jgi:RAB protein geranylgeranyltransferase component A
VAKRIDVQSARTLAKQGFSVLHLDEHEYYGDRHASLTVDEMMQWVEELQSSPSTRYSNASYEFPSAQFKDDLPKVARQYALSLFPTVLPARGDLIETLIDEDVGKYVNFRLVDGVAIFQTTRDGRSSSNGVWKRVPAGKDQIFKDSSLSLLEKRRLMKFIMFASSEKGFTLGAEDVDPLLRGEPGIRQYHIVQLRRTLASQAKNRNRSSST